MKYVLGDRFVLKNVECKVAFINSAGFAYLAPLRDSDEYGANKLYAGLVFAIVDSKGRDKDGNRLYPVSKRSGAV